MPATDPFNAYQTTVLGPAMDIAPVTLDDSNDLAQVTIGIQVLAAGNLKVTMANGQARTIYLTPGVWPIRVTRIWSTGTTIAQASIYAWYGA